MGTRVADHGRAAYSVPPSYDRQRPKPVPTINFSENMADCPSYFGTRRFRPWFMGCVRASGSGDSGQPRELAEHAMAHVVGGVEGAYARTLGFNPSGIVSKLLWVWRGRCAGWPCDSPLIWFLL